MRWQRVNCLVHAELGTANWPRHPAWTRPCTVTGMFSMALTRYYSFGGFFFVPMQFLVLLFGLVVHGCLWLPLLFGRRGRLGWLRPLIVQVLWGGIWVTLGLLMWKGVYRFSS